MNPSVDEILALETQVWEALKTGDSNLDAMLLASDFLGVYPSGFADKEGHCKQLKGGPVVLRYKLSDARLMALSDSLVLLSYRADWTRSSQSQISESMYVSSIWRHTEKGWENVFSQDSPLAGKQS